VPDAPPPDGCCCWPLWNYLTAAGERGLAVVVEDHPEGLSFWLQSRGIAYVDEARIGGDSIAQSKLHVNVSMSSRMRYCPSCATSLDAVATRAPEAFARFAEAHRKFAPPPV